VKVLLIDDDEALANVFSIALKKEGFETSMAHTGEDGLHKAEGEQPNLILLDQVLPDMQGNQVLIQLKSKETTKNIPVIILSNFSQEELVKQAINQGAHEYIFKFQIDTKDLVGKVKSLLQPNPIQAQN
jgi:DNA-binding response OmpR family regulator